MSATVPVVTAEQDTLTAALAYAAAGLYVGPVRAGTKHPGSVLGAGWPRVTSRDPAVVASWFAGTDHGVFIHAGRSGLVVFDVDRPDLVPPVLARAITDLAPPLQSTRTTDDARGHYLFAQPVGRDLGNGVGRLGGAWGEVRGRNGVLVVAPSLHADARRGGAYTWRRTGLVPVLPDYLAELLDDAAGADAPATDAQVTTFLTRHTTDTPQRPELLDVWLRTFTGKVAQGESRHARMVSVLTGAMKEAAAGLLDATSAADTLRTAFLQAVAAHPAGAGQGPARTGAAAHSEWAGLLAWAVAQAQAADPAATLARTSAKLPPPGAPLAALVTDPCAGGAADPTGVAALAGLLTDLRTWQHLPDPGHIVIALAAAATRDDTGEPCWLLLVAPPSSGKTETVRLLDGVADEHLDEVTAAGLLGWSKGKTARPTGVLARIGDRALVTFGDLSTLLATSDRGGRDAVFALLRRAYDGSASRDVSPPGRTEGEHPRLAWSGRLTVVAAVTGAIDRYTAHADQLGPRWVYVRLPERDTADKRAASRQARRRGIAEHRATAAELAARLVAAASTRLPDALPEAVVASVEDAALVTCWGRAAVPRSGYGRREVLDVPTVEEPMRVVQQVSAIARGLYGLGLGDEAVTALTRRVALDSMPAARHAVLAALSTGEVLSTAGVARAAGIDRKVARFALEELEAVGIVSSDRADDESEEPAGAVTWQLAGDDGALVADVFAGQTRCGGWDNMWVAIPPPPQERGRDSRASHVSSHPFEMAS